MYCTSSAPVVFLLVICWPNPNPPFHQDGLGEDLGTSWQTASSRGQCPSWMGEIIATFITYHP